MDIDNEATLKKAVRISIEEIKRITDCACSLLPCYPYKCMCVCHIKERLTHKKI